jgi:hypothetical protein
MGADSIPDASETSGTAAGDELPGLSVSHTRRLAAAMLEVALFSITLGIGWLAWLGVTSKRGQTPAKRLLGLYIHDHETGALASRSQVWRRDLLWKVMMPAIIIAFAGVVAFVLGPLFAILPLMAEALHLLAGARVVLKQDRRAGWDLDADTVVRYHPEH